MQSYLRAHWRDVTSTVVVAAILVMASTGGHIGHVMQAMPDATDNDPDDKPPAGRAVFHDAIGSVTPANEASVGTTGEPIDSESATAPVQQRQDTGETQAEPIEPADVQATDDASQGAKSERKTTALTSTAPPPPTAPRLPRKLRDRPSEEVVKAVQASHRELMEKGKLQLFVDLRGLGPDQVNAIVDFYVFPLSRNDRQVRVSPDGVVTVIQRGVLPDQLHGPLERGVVVWPAPLAAAADHWLAKRHKVEVQFYLNSRSAYAVFSEIRRRNPAAGSTLHFCAVAGKHGEIKFQLDKVEKPLAKSVASASVTVRTQPEEKP